MRNITTKKKNLSKKKCQQDHFSKRCIDRIGYQLTQTTVEKIIQDIQEGKLEFVEKQSNRISKFKYEVLDKSFILVYDRQRKTLVTILYPDEEYYAMT